MELRFSASMANRYKSKPQQSRVLSEAWFASNGYCLACESDQLGATPANTKATDFVCNLCNHRYELKTFTKKPKRNLIDGAYSTMIGRIKDKTAPTLLLLERNSEWDIRSLTAIHHTFLTPNVIMKRNALSPTARRAGWVGCNIRLDLIAQEAQISIVEGGKESLQRSVREAFRRYERLDLIEPKARGWTTLALRVIRSVEKNTFTLNEIYKKEQQFAIAYPGNHNIRPKIRQQLQVLRDLGYIEFIAVGEYRLLI